VEPGGEKLFVRAATLKRFEAVSVDEEASDQLGEGGAGCAEVPCCVKERGKGWRKRQTSKAVDRFDNERIRFRRWIHHQTP
jgi:hypothetical protein